MTESSNNKNYSAADFERYHAGKMPAAEMHALEKAAMEDPFLADALEGYAFASTPQQDLEQVREKLFGEKKEEKTIPLYGKNYSWLRAAAIIIFIAGGTWLAFRLSDTKKEEIALKNEVKKEAATDTIQKTEVAETINQPLTDSTNFSTVQTHGYGIPITSTASSSLTTNEQGFDYYKLSVPDSSREKNVKDVAVLAPPPIVTSDSQLVTLGATSNVYRNQNNAVPYNEAPNMNATAKMTLPGYNNAFAKPVTRKDSNNVDPFMAKENKSKAAAADTITNLDIVLQTDNAGLSEVVVSSSKKQEADKRSFELKVDTLEPKEGWNNFDDYIARNIQVPDELKSKQPYAGEVELAFDINKNGEPVNITVTKSLCNKCDEEAIRLLKEGPKWKKKKAKKGKVTIKF